MRCNRRRLLGAGGAIAFAAAAWPAAPSDARSIALANLHTGERLRREYFRDGAYSTAAMADIDMQLRDWRTGEQHPIDPKLLDYLLDVAAKLDVPAEFSVISGYRSPQTNARLHELSSAVSQHSLHMQGRAIDVRMATVDCEQLAIGAISLRQGGVGYYRASNFVHLDTGAFRTWRG